jgi:hypothetical protein
MRTFLAGVAGAIVMFLWSSIAHMALPLGQVGISEIKNEEAVLFAMQTAIGDESGFYLFPNYGSMADAQAQEQYEARLKTYPSGILVYHPPGAEGMSVRRLVTEFGIELAESLLLAFILGAITLTGFLPKFTVAGAVGGCAVFSSNLSYWNWYGFPLDYTLAAMAMDFVGYLAASVAIILILRRGTVDAFGRRT